MPFKRMNPGCCDCTCVFASDPFTGSSGVPPGWTVVDGTWARNSSQLRCTAAGTIVFDTTWPTSGRWKVSITIASNDTTTDYTVRLLHKYTDADNHYFQEFRLYKGNAFTADITATCVAFGKRESGVETIFHREDGLGAALTLYSEFGETLFAGLGPGLVETSPVTWYGRTAAITLPSSVIPSDKVAIQVVSLGDGTHVAFDNFEWSTCPTFSLLDCAGGRIAYGNSAAESGACGSIIGPGTWILAGHIIFAPGVATYYITKTVYPNWNSYMRIASSAVMGPLQGSSPRLILDAIDEDNYVFGEFYKDGDGFVSTIERARIGTVVAGSETILLDEDAGSVALDGFGRWPMSLCLSGSNTLTLNDTWSTSYTPDTGDTSPRYYGVGRGSYGAGGGGVQFETVTVRKIYDADNTECVDCDDV